jgi:hypothetical protein
MRDYKKLEVWHKSYILGINIYSITKTFPKEEVYGLALIIISSQLYINFAIQGYATNSMLLFILLLVTLALIIYHSRPQLR